MNTFAVLNAMLSHFFLNFTEIYFNKNFAVMSNSVFYK